jgi:predicted DNA-binding transcriptional regulator
MPRFHNRNAGTGAMSEDIIAYVAQVYRDLHRAPSLNEIARHFGISKTQADRNVRNLIRQGVLERSAAPLTRAKGVPGICICATSAPAHAPRTSLSPDFRRRRFQ